MLSIILSSYQPEYFQAFTQSVEETIGDIPFEIIQIWNPDLMGICEAYNKGASKAKYENLLFIHEDVKFDTTNWGLVLLNYLSKPGTGVVGLAGSDYVPNAPASWHSDEKYMYRNIIQYFKDREPQRRYSDLKKVYSLDGVFLAVRKEVYEQYKFHETLKGFHAYDIDFSIRVAQRYENYVIPDILLHHYSNGGFNIELIQNRIIARKNYQIPPEQKTDIFLENKAYAIFLRNMSQVNISKSTIFKEGLIYANPKYLGLKGCFKALKSIVFYLKK